LTGQFTDHHALLVGQVLARLNRVEQALAALDEQIGNAMTRGLGSSSCHRPPGCGAKDRTGDHRRKPGRHVEVPHRGTPRRVGRLAPAMHESAGKRGPRRIPKGNKWPGSILVEAASSVPRTKVRYRVSPWPRSSSTSISSTLLSA
jgi:transposase